jgi:hypothetical protein
LPDEHVHSVPSRSLLLGGPGEVAASRYLEILASGQRRGIGDRTLPSVGHVCRADVDRQAGYGDQNHHQQRCQDQDLAALPLSYQHA